MDNHLYGYEEYQLKELNPRFFDNWNAPRDIYPLMKDWATRYNAYWMRMFPAAYDLYVMIPLCQSDDCNSVKYCKGIAEHIVIPEAGQTLYFLKGCTIPRIRVDEKFKRTARLEKADVVVIPRPHRVHRDKKTCLFADHDRRIMWIGEFSWGISEEKLPKVGQTIGGYIKQFGDKIPLKFLEDTENKRQITECQDASCIYVGPVVYYNIPQQGIFDTLEGVYDKIVFEDDLLDQLGGVESEKITVELAMEFLDRLKSNDKILVEMTLNTLANMDYMACPSLVRYLLYLSEHGWTEFKPKNSAVTTMFRQLEYQRAGWQRERTMLTHVLPDEVELLAPFVASTIREDLQGRVRDRNSMYNFNVDVKYKITITSWDNSKSVTIEL